MKASVSRPLSSAEAARRGVPQPPVADSPSAGHNVPRLADALQDAGLGGVVPVAVVAGVPPERLGGDEVSGLVVPFPVQPDAVVRAVVGQQGEGGDGQRRAAPPTRPTR